MVASWFSFYFKIVLSLFLSLPLIFQVSTDILRVILFSLYLKEGKGNLMILFTFKNPSIRCQWQPRIYLYMLVLSSTQISHHLPYIFYWRAHQNLRFKTSKPYLTIYFLQERFLSGHSLCPIVSDSNLPSFVSPPSISERLSYFHKVTQLVSYEFSFKWIIPLHCAFLFISYSEVKS